MYFDHGSKNKLVYYFDNHPLFVDMISNSCNHGSRQIVTWNIKRQKTQNTSAITFLQIVTTKKVYTPAGGKFNEWGNYVYFVFMCGFTLLFSKLL